MGMQKWNRYVAAALALTMVCTMAAGCGDNNKKDEEETITLRILENDTAKEKGYLEALLNAFNEAYKDKGIVAVDANMDQYTNLAEQGPYGYGPDVIYQANDILMSYAEDKHILPISKDDYECASQIPDAAWDAFTINIDGDAYICGLPVNIQEPMLFYRSDMLPENWESDWDKDGDKTPDFLQNWNDLYAFSAYLRESDTSENKDEKYGFMSSFNNLYLNAEFLLSYGAYVFKENEDGTLDASDIGFGAGDAATGLGALRQMAGVMNEGCIDDTIISNRYQKLADGIYFCAVSTPDTKTLFIDKLALTYEAEGLSAEEAKAKAEENLCMIELPGQMPKDGDLSKDASTMTDADWVETKVMGGVNGYGISSYTKHQDACKEFVNFATSYEMIQTRQELLGIAPTRSDVAKEAGGVTDMIFESLDQGRIYLMPSIKAVDQIWTPSQTLMGDVAKDPYRQASGETEKYATADALQKALDDCSKEIYDAIFTLAE